MNKNKLIDLLGLQNFKENIINFIQDFITTSLSVSEKGISVLDGTIGKILNDKGTQISVYKSADGTIHFRDWDGVDTEIFSLNGITTEQPKEPGDEEVKQLIKNTMNVYLSNNDNSVFSYYLEDVSVDKIESIHINEVILKAKASNVNYKMMVIVFLSYEKEGQIYQETLGTYTISSTTAISKIIVSDYDVDLSALIEKGAEKITKIDFRCFPQGTKSASYYNYFSQFDIDAVVKYKGI